MEKTDKHLVTVVIPIYKTELSAIERWAVARNLSLLAPNREIAIVCPQDLDITPLNTLFGLNSNRCHIERFAPAFFDGRLGYNQLMLSEDFYSRFHNSQFVVICQTDVVLFHDDLDYWCSLDYDYIGAPWLPAAGDVQGWNLARRAFFKLRRGWARFRGGFHPVLLKWKVGNGGFSLRRVEAMLRVLYKHPAEIAEIAKDSSHTANFEDVVWSVRINELWPNSLRIPDYTTAAHFSIEGHPEMAMSLTGGQLPMGTHAFYHHRNRKFWSKFLDFTKIEHNILELAEPPSL